MINPRNAWCIQVDVTNACHLHCSNCTRLLDHMPKRYFMSPECFRMVLKSVKGFLARNPDGSYVHKEQQGWRRKVVGIIGGEPLLHPQFPELVTVMCEEIPDPKERGLWTSKDFKSIDPVTGKPLGHGKWGPYLPQVERLLTPFYDGDVRDVRVSGVVGGYLNWNTHSDALNVHHQPMLNAIGETALWDGESWLHPGTGKHTVEMWRRISDCWVQREWSPTYTDDGFYFCEVAAALDKLLSPVGSDGKPHGVAGLPVEGGEWSHPLDFMKDVGTGRLYPLGVYKEQVERCCVRCGACVKSRSRRDKENTDDVSALNLHQIQAFSPRVKRGEIKMSEQLEEKVSGENEPKPQQYMRPETKEPETKEPETKVDSGIVAPEVKFGKNVSERRA